MPHVDLSNLNSNTPHVDGGSSGDAMGQGGGRGGRKRTRGGPLSTVAYKRPRCPVCGHAALQRYRSLADQGDGTALAWVLCLNEACGHRFRLLLE